MLGDQILHQQLQPQHGHGTTPCLSRDLDVRQQQLARRIPLVN
jgi:hypothetical protein